MTLTGSTRTADMVLLAVAVLVFPFAKIALMFWEYRLHWPMHQFAEPTVLLIGLGVAVLAATYCARSYVEKLARIAAVAVWCCVAYMLVVFVPGCMWAPACV